MPSFHLNGNLGYFVARSRHIGFHSAAEAIAKLKGELSRCKSGKGPVQSALREALPRDLIFEIVRFRITENTVERKR
jgi:uncharacterized protein YdhG (YjbR/CyaY superfamily)